MGPSLVQKALSRSPWVRQVWRAKGVRIKSKHPFKQQNKDVSLAKEITN